MIPLAPTEILQEGARRLPNLELLLPRRRSTTSTSKTDPSLPAPCAAPSQFAGTGKLRDVIQSRRTHQKQRKLIDGREKQKAAKKAHAPKGHGAPGAGSDGEDGEGDEEDESHAKGKKGGDDDDIMGEGFMGEEVDDEASEGDDDEDDDAAENDTDDDFAELDDIEGAFDRLVLACPARRSLD